MTITPDSVVYWQWGPVVINATLVFTWVTMALLVGVSVVVTRKLTPGFEMGRGQNALEAVVGTLREQIREVSRQDPERFLSFIGTLFLFIVLSNVLGVIPGYQSPTGSLTTTAALAVCVFFAVPLFGIQDKGLSAYLKNYIKPTPIMLPFNIIGELSRTLALAVRLFGNIMSGSLIAAILIGVVPLFFPVVMNVFSILIGVIQAYIFSVLAMVYIASGTAATGRTDEKAQDERKGEP
ncbi:MAG: F0F1 ATP synthase subunit A [Proteobacteria bacterium]|nr:F0F1 ATP synthase subunit A [Pseudomonadota bacterium]